MPHFGRFRSEAIVDIAADRLDIKISRRLAGKVQLYIAAHGLALDLRIRRGRESRGKFAGYRLEPRARYGAESQMRIAAHRGCFDVCISAGQYYIAADGFHLDHLRSICR